jgi:hypothetical protein
MSVSVTASIYNNLRDRVNLVMGKGSTGYGQDLLSTAVQSGQTFTNTMWNNLRTDMLKARQHQTGVSEAANLTQVTTTTPITSSLITQYDNFCTLITTNQRVCANNQATIETMSVATRSLAWNGVIAHTITLAFANSLRARYFFNAGGQIRFTASRTGAASSSKDTDWSNLLSSMGTIRMDYNSTSFLAGGSGTGSTKGFYNLTTTPQQVYFKGSSVYAYTENDYNIQASVNNATDPINVILRIEFRDDDLGNRPYPAPPPPFGPKVDETVTGTLNSTVTIFRPSGANVSVTAPVLQGTGTNNIV